MQHQRHSSAPTDLLESDLAVPVRVDEDERGGHDTFHLAPGEGQAALHGEEAGGGVVEVLGGVGSHGGVVGLEVEEQDHLGGTDADAH